MGVKSILDREHELNAIIFKRLKKIKNLCILAENNTDRLGIFSFYIENAHYNLIVKLLNDKFGVQTRGGCSCADTYGHYLLNVNESTSIAIKNKILEGCLMERPGWVRMSIHPTVSTDEIESICDAIENVAKHYKTWEVDYTYNAIKNEYLHKGKLNVEKQISEHWFEL